MNKILPILLFGVATCLHGLEVPKSVARPADFAKTSEKVAKRKQGLVWLYTSGDFKVTS